METADHHKYGISPEDEVEFVTDLRSRLQLCTPLVSGTKGVHNCTVTLVAYSEDRAAADGLPVEER